MNYLMLQRELKTLSEDLGQMSESVIGPEPPERKQLPRVALPIDEVRKQLEYIAHKLRALVDLVGEETRGDR